jgi:hypothetical protein
METKKDNQECASTSSSAQQPQIGTPQHITQVGFQADLLDILQKSNRQAARRARVAAIGGKE